MKPGDLCRKMHHKDAYNSTLVYTDFPYLAYAYDDIEVEVEHTEVPERWRHEVQAVTGTLFLVIAAQPAQPRWQQPMTGPNGEKLCDVFVVGPAGRVGWLVEGHDVEEIA